ncbi:MAG: 50S ribosomal protein L5 [Candidatus Latescibacterota bacterium]|nr:50S ribosomal protein L5 [Candidatus Latescibacterota bacterium]
MNTTRLMDTYAGEVVPALQERFQYDNAMQIPKLQKIVVNAGVGDAVQDSKVLDNVITELAAITGQKPAVRRARKAISNFKLREGVPIGAMVTLRQSRMFEFLDRLVNFALPQSRDFRGVSPRGFDGRGNYNLGIKEQIIFPEVNYDRIDRIRGMNIAFVTSAQSDEEAKELLRLFGIPFGN